MSDLNSENGTKIEDVGIFTNDTDLEMFDNIQSDLEKVSDAVDSPTPSSVFNWDSDDDGYDENPHEEEIQDQLSQEELEFGSEEALDSFESGITSFSDVQSFGSVEDIPVQDNSSTFDTEALGPISSVNEDVTLDTDDVAASIESENIENNSSTFDTSTLGQISSVNDLNADEASDYNSTSDNQNNMNASDSVSPSQDSNIEGTKEEVNSKNQSEATQQAEQAQQSQHVSGLAALFSKTVSLPGNIGKGIYNAHLQNRIKNKAVLDFQESLKSTAVHANKVEWFQNALTKDYPDFVRSYDNLYNNYIDVNKMSPFAARAAVLEELKKKAEFKTLFEDERFKQLISNYDLQLEKLSLDVDGVMANMNNIKEMQLPEAKLQSVFENTDGLQDLLDPNGVLSRLKAAPSLSDKESPSDLFKNLQERFGEMANSLKGMFMAVLQAFQR